MADLMTFSEGQELKFLPERKGSWLPEKIIVEKVFDHGRVLPGVSHRYSVRAADGHTYSGWWFDPNAVAIYDDGISDDY